MKWGLKELIKNQASNCLTSLRSSQQTNLLKLLLANMWYKYVTDVPQILFVAVFSDLLLKI